MIFIDFGLLRSIYCKISYLLAEEHWSHTNLGIWQPTYDSVCKDNSWIHGKCRQRFLSNVYKLFFIFSTFLRFLTFFLFSSQRLLHLWLQSPRLHCSIEDTRGYEVITCGSFSKPISYRVYMWLTDMQILRKRSLLMLRLSLVAFLALPHVLCVVYYYAFNGYTGLYSPRTSDGNA